MFLTVGRKRNGIQLLGSTPGSRSGRTLPESTACPLPGIGFREFGYYLFSGYLRSGFVKQGLEHAGKTDWPPKTDWAESYSFFAP